MQLYYIPEWLLWLITVGSIGLPSLLAIGGLFLRSYWAKRAENLATKQDLAELTRIAEGIKADLDVQSQRRISLDNEARVSILRFYNDLHQWHTLSTDPTLGVDDHTDDHVMEQARSALRNALRTMRGSRANFEFFVRDSQLHDAADIVISKTAVLHRCAERAILEVMRTNIEISQLKQTHGRTVEGLRVFNDGYRKMLGKQNDILASFIDEIKPLQSDAKQANDAFIKLARQLLYP